MLPLRSDFFIYLFSAVRWQVESKNCQEGDAHAGNNDVHSVEQSLPPHRDVECDVQVRLVAACVEFLVSKKTYDINLNIKVIHARGISSSLAFLLFVSTCAIKRIYKKRFALSVIRLVING